MRLSLIAFGVLLSSVAGCGGSSPATPVYSPFLMAIDPKDHARFEQIQQSPLETRFKEQIEYLQSRNHDIEWFPSTVGSISEHETVQLIYFDYAKHVVGFCSGAFLSENYVVSAGHCNNAVYGLQRAGASCEANLLFAYRPKVDGKIHYYRCDKVVVSVNDKSKYSVGDPPGPQEDIYHSDDYALFRLANAAGNPPLKTPFLLSRELLEKASALAKSEVLLGFVVDPPLGNQSFLSKYDVIVSEVVDGKETSAKERFVYMDGVYARSTHNRYQSGNSGGPIYRVRPESVTDPKSTFYEARTYVGPVGGLFPGSAIHIFSAPSLYLQSIINIAQGK